MKKYIMTFLSVIFMIMISLDKVKAYDNSSIYLDYTNQKFLNYVSEINDHYDYVYNDCSAKYTDFLITLHYDLDLGNSSGILFQCFELDDQKQHTRGFYDNKSSGRFALRSELQWPDSSYSMNYTYYSIDNSNFPAQVNEITTLWRDNDFYDYYGNRPFSNLDYFEEKTNDYPTFIPVFATLDLIYYDYNEYTSHLYVNNEEIAHSEAIPLPFNQVEDPPAINFISKYNIYYTRMSLMIDIESSIYTNQYSFDGITWIDIPPNSAMTLFFSKNGYVIARVYDSTKDKVITAQTFNITQIRTFTNELEEINNKFDSEDLSSVGGFMSMINNFVGDIGSSVAVITGLTVYGWSSLNGYIKYFILSIGFILVIVALIKLFLKGK